MENLFENVSEILSDSRMNPKFMKKKTGYGIKGTSQYDHKDLIQSALSYVLEAPYNTKLYEKFVSLGLFPKYMIGDLVQWYKEYPPKTNFELNQDRIDVIENIGVNLLGSINYLTKEFNNEENTVPKIGKAHQSYIEKCGISPYSRFKTLGKEQDYMTEIESQRLYDLMKQELKDLKLPKNHIILKESFGWCGGHTIGSVSYGFSMDFDYFRKNPDAKKIYLSAEIRIPFRALATEKLEAVLWLNFNLSGSKNKSIDLFEDDNYKDRFVYAPDFKELFKLAKERLNHLILKNIDMNDEVIDLLIN